MKIVSRRLFSHSIAYVERRKVFEAIRSEIDWTCRKQFEDARMEKKENQIATSRFRSNFDLLD